MGWSYPYREVFIYDIWENICIYKKKTSNYYVNSFSLSDGRIIFTIFCPGPINMVQYRCPCCFCRWGSFALQCRWRYGSLSRVHWITGALPPVLVLLFTCCVLWLLAWCWEDRGENTRDSCIHLRAVSWVGVPPKKFSSELWWLFLPPGFAAFWSESLSCCILKFPISGFLCLISLK